ncbi:TPA: DUF4113 domain-containing protein [Yersinia enterocolitica]|nr:DUF4113 domain-containing protein [Yersinia enterocolitica]
MRVREVTVFTGQGINIGSKMRRKMRSPTYTTC